MAEDRSFEPQPERVQRASEILGSFVGVILTVVGAVMMLVGSGGFVGYLWKFTHECAPSYEPGIGCYGGDPFIDAVVTAAVGVALLISGLLIALRR